MGKLTHHILNTLKVPRHKDGNRLGIGARMKLLALMPAKETNV